MAHVPKQSAADASDETVLPTSYFELGYFSWSLMGVLGVVGRPGDLAQNTFWEVLGLVFYLGSELGVNVRHCS